MRAEPAAAGWLLRRPSDEARGRIFCFPYSGVGASMFSAWPTWMNEVEICPIQLPGRENRIREPHYGTYSNLATKLLEPLLPYLDRPFVFFGHCAGSLPAFETAVQLAEQNLPIPRRLFVSAQVAPHDCPHDRFLQMTDAELRAELTQLAVNRGGMPHPALLDLGLAILRNDLEANRAYCRPSPVAVPFGITVVHWADDSEVTQNELRGWQSYNSSVKFPVLDGGHYEFLKGPRSLLDLVAGVLS